MILWFLLFLLTVAISVVFAIRSLGEYQERPANFSTPYSLFLIRNPQALTTELMNKLNQLSVNEGWIFSFEKLFKGQKQALVVYGPISLLRDFIKELDLLELEDYSEKVDEKASSILVCELGLKNSLKDEPVIKKIDFANIKFKDQQDFWLQTVLRPIAKSSNFEVTIRAVVNDANTKDAQELQKEVLNEVSDNGLVLIPQPYSTEQLVKFYRARVGPKINLLSFDKNKTSLTLESKDIRSLLGL